IPVVSHPLLRVPEHLVGGDDQPELLLGVRVARIEVRVIRLGGLAESRPDSLRAGVPRHAKNIIRRLHNCLSRMPPPALATPARRMQSYDTASRWAAVQRDQPVAPGLESDRGPPITVTRGLGHRQLKNPEVGGGGRGNSHVPI